MFLELSEKGRQINVRFGYDPELVEVVRALPGRRWHPAGKYWSVPMSHLEEALRRLLPLGFKPTAELREHLVALSSDDSAPLFDPATDDDSEPVDLTADLSEAQFQGMIGDALGLGPLPEVAEALGVATPFGRRESQDLDPSRPLFGHDSLPSPAAAPPALSVSELNREVRAVLTAGFPEALWLHGEIVGYDRNAHKLHTYFQLVDKAEHEDRPRATVNAVLFDGAKRDIDKLLGSCSEPWKLADGLRVRVRGRVDLYPPSGSYQFIVESVDPEFTLGEIARRRERILAELDRLGLRERNLRLPFARPCLRIALLSSYESDAYNDFLNELQRSGYPFEVTVFDCHVQGERVEGDMLRALSVVERNCQEFDAVVIVRGGGARTDLMGFDSLPLGQAVAQHPCKVLVGIGHHRDRSVLDFICHAEKTPTAVAKALVERAQGEERGLLESAQRLQRLVENACRLEGERLQRRGWQLSRALERSLERQQQRLMQAAAGVSNAASRRLREARQRLQWQGTRGAREIKNQLRANWQRWREQVERLPRLWEQRLRSNDKEMRGALQRVRNLDPRRILARGFAWVRGPSGESIKGVDQVGVEQSVDILLRDGSLRAKIERKSGPRDDSTRES